jgi:hypothetical protein
MVLMILMMLVNMKRQMVLRAIVVHQSTACQWTVKAYG